MRKINRWYILLGASLILSSAVLYLIHYAVFRDAHHIFVFLLEDIAFVPIHVLLITLIIDRLLNEREKLAMFNRLNMVVGAFFNETGTALLKQLPAFDKSPERIAPHLLVDGHWTDNQFFAARAFIKTHEFDIDSRKGDLAGVRVSLVAQRSFLLRLLENPTLTEYASFTKLLLAVFHLSDELSHRERVDDLPAEDYDHLSLDIERAYRRLIFEWLRYMHHLKRDYPFLFSLAVRTNPFDPLASVIVKNQLEDIVEDASLDRQSASTEE